GRWLKALEGSTSVNHAAMVDINEQTLARASSEFGGGKTATFTDYVQAFEEVDADFALIVVPPFIHEEVATAAFDNGLHVLTEKPMAHDMGSARRMVEKSIDTSNVLMVSQNYRFRRWIRTARAYLETGKLGRISHCIISFRLNPDWGPFRQKMDDVLMIEMSIHHFDMMRYILNRDPVSIFARTWNPPWSWFNGDCATAISIDMGGIPVLYEGSSVSFGSHTGWNGEWRIECERGSLDFDEVKGLRVTNFDEGEDSIPQIDMPAEDQEYSLLEFESSLNEDRPPETNGPDNLKSLAMVFGAIQSKSSEEIVRIENLLK
ncbi:MAG: Gfo/Idh/MocA family oxidoreductase, partial [Theionarchaea archaeon]|nr:Gfo/Idh/MocA family oxidoreductase [Theionarchaea archaeon]